MTITNGPKGLLKKQLVNIDFTLKVLELKTAEFWDVRTGQRVHADFADGVLNDVCLSTFIILGANKGWMMVLLSLRRQELTFRFTKIPMRANITVNRYKIKV